MLQEISWAFFCNDNTNEENDAERQEEFLYGSMRGYFDKFVDATEEQVRRLPRNYLKRIANYPLFLQRQ